MLFDAFKTTGFLKRKSIVKYIFIPIHSYIHTFSIKIFLLKTKGKFLTKKLKIQEYGLFNKSVSLNEIF